MSLKWWKRSIKEKPRITTTIIENEDEDPFFCYDTKDDLLISSIKEYNYTLIEKYVFAGANVNYSNSTYGGETPLHVAVKTGKIDIVKFLVQYGANVNKKTNSGVPLSFAAGRGYVDIIEYLLDCGADINLPNREGETPLHYAAFMNSIEGAATLLFHDALTETEGWDGKTWKQISTEDFKREVEILVLRKQTSRAFTEERLAKRFDDLNNINCLLLGKGFIVKILDQEFKIYNAVYSVRCKENALHPLKIRDL